MNENENENKRSTSEFAVASLVLGIVSLINLFNLEKAIPAIVFGVLALKRIKKDNRTGKGLAIWGISLAALSFIFAVIFMIRFGPEICRSLQRN